MSSTYDHLPLSVRKTIVESTARAGREARDDHGWDAPHSLWWVRLHSMGENASGETVFGQDLEPFPISYEGIPGNSPAEKLLLLGLGLSHLALAGTLPTLPDGCAGLVFVAESWIATQTSRPAPGDPQPSERPDREECVMVNLVDLQGNVATALAMRGETEVYVQDIEEQDSASRDLSRQHSHLIEPLIALGQFLGSVSEARP